MCSALAEGSVFALHIWSMLHQQLLLAYTLLHSRINWHTLSECQSSQL